MYLETLTPQQWAELQAADAVDPQGERREDMRMAFAISQNWMMQGIGSHVSLWDVLASFDYQMTGKRGDEKRRQTPDEMARIGTGGR